jgi:hypothetical protein
VIDNDAALITRAMPLTDRAVTVTRNDRKTGTLTAKLFDRPSAPVYVYVRYPRDLTGSVDNRKGSKTKLKRLTFTRNNWNNVQTVRVWYKPGSGGKGTKMTSINFKVTSKDRRYNNIKARAVKVRILDNNRVGIRTKVVRGTAHGSARSASTAAPVVTTVRARLRTTAPEVVAGQLPPEVAASWDARAIVGHRYSLPAAVDDGGARYRAGTLRVAKLVPESATGFDSSSDAASLARRTRAAAAPSSAARWLVLQGANRRYYVYEAALVSQSADTELTALGAITLYAFAPKWVAWQNDAAEWHAAKDTATS